MNDPIEWPLNVVTKNWRRSERLSHGLAGTREDLEAMVADEESRDGRFARIQWRAVDRTGQVVFHGRGKRVLRRTV